MSNNMNALSEKVGDVSRAVSTACGIASTALDAAAQTRHRQQHVHDLIEMLRRDTGPVDRLNMLHQLEMLDQRCPDITTLSTSLTNVAQAQHLAVDAIGELYEMVEKMRDLASATL